MSLESESIPVPVHTSPESSGAAFAFGQRLALGATETRPLIGKNVRRTSCYRNATQLGSTGWYQAAWRTKQSQNSSAFLDYAGAPRMGWDGDDRISSAVLSTTQPPLRRGSVGGVPVVEGVFSEASESEQGRGNRNRQMGSRRPTTGEWGDPKPRTTT
jgi:hypothetical protein